MCYKEPALTAEDKEWDAAGYDSDVAPPSAGKAAQDTVPAAAGWTPLCMLQDSTLESNAHHAQGKASNEGEQQQRLKKKPRMTTSVQLPAAHAGPSAIVEEDAKPDGSKEAMAGFPLEMQRYMQAEGFAQPTPVQQQCAQSLHAFPDLRSTPRHGPSSPPALAQVLARTPARTRCACRGTAGQRQDTGLPAARPALAAAQDS